MLGCARVDGAIDARAQFVAVGAGVIVGRCGAHSAARMLSPQLASDLGRQWIVCRARSGLFKLIQSTSVATSEFVAGFSVSHTLGLVDPVAEVCRGDVVAWVQGSGGCCGGGGARAARADADCGRRSPFKLAVVRKWVNGSQARLALWDVERNSEVRLGAPDQIVDVNDVVLCNRKWMVVFTFGHIVIRKMMPIGLPSSSSKPTAKPPHIAMIDKPNWLSGMILSDEDSVAVIQKNTWQWDDFSLLIIDLPKSHATGTLSCATRPVKGQQQRLWCYDGKLYVSYFPDSTCQCIECVTTGQRISVIEPIGTLTHIGGPFYTLPNGLEDSSSLYNMNHPPGKTAPQSFDVADAVSGIRIFTLQTTAACGLCDSTTKHAKGVNASTPDDTGNHTQSSVKDPLRGNGDARAIRDSIVLDNCRPDAGLVKRWAESSYPFLKEVLDLAANHEFEGKANFIQELSTWDDFSLLIIDLPKSHATGTLSCATRPVKGQQQRLWCYDGKLYVSYFPDSTCQCIECVTTGQRISVIEPIGALTHIGGPFYTLPNGLEDSSSLYNMNHPPGKVLRVVQGTSSRTTKWVNQLMIQQTAPQSFDVADAVSGIRIFTLQTTAACGLCGVF
ncbi:hypothetical protein Pelo_7061 [Pelomyxa schiedti]|nr:hypothetical protein Pelo_7061 [Pelomyxa schiedti]